MQITLTIAGFDPSSGAGVTADLMVFAAHGLYGTACITALTVQSTLGVEAVEAVPSEVVGSMLSCLQRDLPPNGVKIGMLLNAANASTVDRYLSQNNNENTGITRRVPVVFDPVLRSSSGKELMEPEGLAVLKEQLLPQVDWITPNTDELAVLSGLHISGKDDVAEACRILQRSVGSPGRARRLGIFATGGHLERPDDFLLTPDGEEHWLPGERVETTSTHGTGCVLSSAFLSRLVLGDEPLAAAKAAKAYVRGALQGAVRVGGGVGPVNPLWALRV